MFDYKIHADNDSMYNTPPCWSIYICGLVFEHLLKKGGRVPCTHALSLGWPCKCGLRKERGLRGMSA